MGCPTNLCKRVNMVVDSQGIMRDNKDLVKKYKAEPLPTLVGKPERVTELNKKIKKDEAKTKSNLKAKAGNSATLTDGDTTTERPVIDENNDNL